MKILILATPRSGSTSLTNLIYSHLKQLKYTLFIEPFNSNFYNSYKNKGFDFETTYPLEKFKNLLVKTLLLSDNNEYPKKSFDNIESYLEWCITFFDKIIILDRKNKLQQSESFAFNEIMFRTYGIDWHVPKKYDISVIDKNYLETMINRYEESSKLLKDLSNKNNIPIFYYEDIFLNNTGKINDLFCSLNLECNNQEYSNYLIQKLGKVRMDNNKNKLI